MTQQLLIWFSVVFALIIVFVLRAGKRLDVLSRLNEKLHFHIGLVSEREMFYCPGDMSDDEEL